MRFPHRKVVRSMKQPFSVLRQFVREKEPLERCELCSMALVEEHQHLIEPAARKLLCSCDACSILFSERSDLKYKRVPRDVQFLHEFRLTNAQWDQLMIPINMAFFFFSSPENRVIVLYPSPAGATESLLRLESWNEVVRENPLLQKMRPDVEALLVNRLGKVAEHYLVPIDQCYKLVGLIRAKWRGLSGGTEAWEEIHKFFETLSQKSGRKESHA